MKATTRLFLILLCTMVALTSVAVAEKCPCKGCKVKKTCKCGQMAEAKDPADVWWGNRGVSFRNYMKFDRLDLTKPAEPAPEFEPIYFDLDKSVLRPDGIVTAEKVLQYMKDNPEERVIVEGHCCDLATQEYNMALGERRAAAVKKFLADHGICASRIDTASYGEEQRVTTAPDERPLNRRAIVLVACTG